MRIALAQINPTVGDLAGNASQIAHAAAIARSSGARLMVTPELAMCGYPPHDWLRQQGYVEACVAAVGELARKEARDGLAILVGHPGLRPGTSPGKPLTNSASMLDDGRVVQTIHKRLLPTYDVFSEDRYFEAAAEASRPVVLDGVKLGVHICEDAWNDSTFWQQREYASDPVSELAKAGAEILINLSASPWCMGRDRVRREMFAHACQRHGLPGILVNQAGANDHLIFDGHSFAVDGGGRVVVRLAGFGPDLAAVEFSDGAVRAAGAASGAAAEAVDSGDMEQLAAALELGVRDYCVKTGFRQVHIGLSGGIDSGLVAVIAARALGADRVHCIGMPGPYSSEGSVSDARALCQSLGCRFDVIPVSGCYDAAMATLAPQFAGTPFGLAEENSQARLRGVVLMALSNKFGSLVLACGNKSELAVGYSTLYGDMCGGLEVIGDVYKTNVYELAAHYNRVKPGTIPEAMIAKPPSAELRPDQKDTDSLPPYEVLDPMLEAYIEDAMSVQQLERRFGDGDLVRRIVRMVDMAEYKRRQAPPVLRVTRRAFGPGRAMPVVQRFGHGW